MRLAIVHDYLNQFGGAERVVTALHEIWPEAPIYTSIYAAARLPQAFQNMDIRTSFMQKIPFVSPLYRWFFLLYPLAFESFDLGEYDVILSSSSAWAKGVKKRLGQLHICYCHTPMRFVWRYDDYVKREAFSAGVKWLLPFLLAPVKQWDLETVPSVNYFVANSKVVADRIWQVYGRETEVIYPPVECSLFTPAQEDFDYFLVISRLNAYKRLDIVIEAFNQLDIPLKIVGDGPERRSLQKTARPNIEFLGRLSDASIAKHLAGCRALIFPGEEDFGIVPLEAMAAGRPVIAYQEGGARETVREGENGLFFMEQSAEALMQAVNQFCFKSFDKQKIRSWAEKFDKSIFQQKIHDYVSKKYKERVG